MITRIWFVLIGAAAIMSFAILLLVIIPQGLLVQVQAPPQLKPYEGKVARGREVYAREGCIYCHSQQVRDAQISSDQARGWGRPSVPSDYVYDSPHLLGTMRTGPDLINVGARLPDRQWHLLHLYQPRAVADWSIMPSFRYLFHVVDEAPIGAEVVKVPAPWAPNGIVVASADASALVDYLLSMKRDWPIPEEAGDE